MPAELPPLPGSSPDLELLQQRVREVRSEIQKVIVGQHELVDQLIAALLAGGHVLVEGVPGIAKTLTAKLLSRTLSVDFSRIQFTPDLMPADVTGTSVFSPKQGEFVFNRGPIFSNIVLIDEINRAPAKTQAALFEVMEERQVAVDGKCYPMAPPFMVLATQNPIEQEGTYRLPEAQLDRFLFRVRIHYPNLEEERQILQRFREDFSGRTADTVRPVFSSVEIERSKKAVEKVFVRPELLDYIAQVVFQTRNHPGLFLGASPRASLAIMKTAKAVAAMDGRDFVTPDDVRSVSLPVLNHRVILTPEREMEGVRVDDVIGEILNRVEVPM